MTWSLVNLLQVGSLMARNTQLATIVAMIKYPKYGWCTTFMIATRNGFVGVRQNMEFFLYFGIPPECLRASSSLRLRSRGVSISSPSSIRSREVLTTSLMSKAADIVHAVSDGMGRA